MLVIMTRIVSLVKKVTNIRYKAQFDCIPCNLKEIETYDKDFYEWISQRLQEEGFEYDGEYEIIDNSRRNSCQSYCRRYIHKESGSIAEINHYSLPISNISVEKIFSLRTILKDDFHITSIIRKGAKTSKTLEETYLAYEGMDELDTLINQHMQLLKEKQKEHLIEYKYIQMSHQEYLNHTYYQSCMKQVASKVLKYDAKEQCFKYTIKGIIETLFKAKVIFTKKQDLR